MESFQDMPDSMADDRPGRGFGQMNPFSGNMTRPDFDPSRLRGRLRDTNQAPVLLGVGGALLAVSICLLAARLWCRLRPKCRIHLDDVTVLGATVLALVQYILLAVAVLNGLGRRAIFVPAARRSTAMRLLFVSQLFWYWGITLVKLSVALLLLRLKHTRAWRSFLFSIMGVAIAAAVVQTCFQFLQCRPFSVYWDPRLFKSAQCFRRSIINGNIIVFSAIQIVLDVVFSAIPITFVRKLKRPRREKIFMCVLMGLGLFASCAAVVRTLALQDLYTTPDVFRINVSISTWAVLEQNLALVAATMPTLKAFMERTLVKVGLWFYDEESEGRVRREMVKLGLLDEGDELVRDERSVVARTAGTRRMGGEGSTVAKTKTKTKTHTTTVRVSNEDRASFEAIMVESAKEKEFV